MNFFEQQDIAQRNTKRLVFLLCLAVISLIAITTLLFATVFYYMELNSHRYLANSGLWQGVIHAMSWEMLAGISAAVCSVIFLGSLYKLVQLSGGGRAVAEAMGGRPLNMHNANLDEKKILNVVEEMAIASGTPVPPVYIIEDSAINAFAAGHTPQDAVIGITRGCIHLLSRDELQGVIAHEFSHIFHGDMKLNMRLVALLNGILLLGLIGEFLLRNAGNRSVLRSSKDKSPAAMMGIGLGLIVIGYAGTFCGSLIKAAVSRQREFLADASAVKFTRNPDGIAGALKKIGGYSSGSHLQADNAAQFSHMFFGEGVASRNLFNAMATHPPLSERIKRIDPHWDGKFISINAQTENSYIEEARLVDSNTDDLLAPIAWASSSSSSTLTPNVEQVLQTIGHPTQSHIIYAQQTLHEISENLRNAAHTPWEAQAMMLGLLLDKNADAQAVQWHLLGNLFSAVQIAALKPMTLAAASLAPHLRLPLLELSLPALKQLSLQQYVQFKTAMTALIHADQHINLVEWCYFKILTHNLEPRKTSSRMLDLSQLQTEACTLLSVIANAGSNTEAQAQAAFDGSKITLGFEHAQLFNEADYSMMDLDLAISRLQCVKPLQKPKLLKAMSQCILADQQITVAEAELFRAVADALDCPVPPLIAANP